MKTILASALLLACSSVAIAQPPAPMTSPLLLATIPGLSSEQQQGLHKIFLQRRDAEEALMTKQRAELDALRAKARSEHQRIEETMDASLRKLLGDEGYRKFAEWQLAQRPVPRGLGLPQRPGSGNAGHGHAGGMPDPGVESNEQSQAAPLREGDEGNE